MFSHRIHDDIYLKLLEPNDADDLFDITDGCRKYLREWLPWVDGTKSVDDSKSFIEISMNQYASNNGFQAGIWFHNQLVGCIGFHAIDWSNRRTSIGYWLAEGFQGHGIMTQATQALVDIAFKEYKLNRVEILAAEQNHKSRAIPERLGFIAEGCLPEYEWLYDHFVDHIVYGMLASNWDLTSRRS